MTIPQSRSPATQIVVREPLIELHPQAARTTILIEPKMLWRRVPPNAPNRGLSGVPIVRGVQQGITPGLGASGYSGSAPSAVGATSSAQPFLGARSTRPPGARTRPVGGYIRLAIGLGLTPVRVKQTGVEREWSNADQHAVTSGPRGEGIKARNRPKSTGTARSAILAVGRFPAASCRNSGKTGSIGGSSVAAESTRGAAPKSCWPFPLRITNRT